MKQNLIILILLAGLHPLFGQARGMHVFTTAGSSIESNNLVVSWTIGEDLLDFSLLDPSMTGKPGNHSDVLEMKDGTLLKVYPTLTTGWITVEIIHTEESELLFELIDLKGSKLRIINETADRMELDLGIYVPGSYLLRVINKDYTDQVMVRITKV